MKLRRLLFSFGVTCGLLAILLLVVCWPARDPVALATPAAPVVTGARPAPQQGVFVALGSLLLVVGLGWPMRRRLRETVAAAFARPAHPFPSSPIYRALAALVIAALLAGMVPGPGPTLGRASSIAYAASEERPAARPQNQTSDAASGQGHELLEGPMGVQVNTYNGNLFYDRFDMEIPGCGLGVSLS